MTESARPQSVVPAPPQVFRQWVKRHALIAVGVTVFVILFFVVRMLLRERNPMEGFCGWRVWVADAPASNGYGRPGGIALDAGGERLDVEATVMPHTVRWGSNGAAPTTWSAVFLTTETGRQLVRQDTLHLGSFALLGETRTIDGVVWQEAWRIPPSDHGPTTDRSTQSGVWRVDGAAEVPSNVRLRTGGSVYAAGESESADDAESIGTWAACDGVILISVTMEPAGEATAPTAPGGRRRQPRGEIAFVIARLAPDGRSFSGFESTGAAVTGSRDE